MNDPYRIADVPKRDSTPALFLEMSETKLEFLWNQLAAQRARLVDLYQTASYASSAALLSAQLAFIDSQMNGLLIVQAFQRLRGTAL